MKPRKMNRYPPVGFHYIVSFNGIGNKIIDTRFQSVSGLSVEMEQEQVIEGGENRFTHALPLRSNYSDLVLKRGMARDSDLVDWFMDAFENMKIQPVSMIISLLNENKMPLVSWNIVHAWPKKWSVSDFDAEKSALVIETLELSYRTFSIIR